MPNYIQYRSDLKLKARKNRNNSTKPETIMWYQLLIKQKTGYKFMRQKLIGNYIVVFYSTDLKLAIEVDRDTHAEQVEYDLKRNKILENFGIKIIRYNNSNVIKNINGIYTDLMQKIQQRTEKNQVQLEV